MAPKHHRLLLLAFVAIGYVAAQNTDELQIPVENDNQFPPDKLSDTIDGSGDGAIDHPEQIDETTTEGGYPPIEQIQTKILAEDIGAAAPSGDDDLCPKPCVCRIEGSTTNDFVVDCSGYDLTEFPTPINEKTTILYLQKNKLTEIPKEISSLKNLRVLKANDNSITTLAPGSVSELPALVTLELRNNRLIEYPNDLKNSFGLTKLQELDLGGNDMRTALSADLFSVFEELRTIILPLSTPELQQDLCDALPEKLENVCTESCENQLFECRDGKGIEDDLPALPGMLPLDEDDNADPAVNIPEEDLETDEKTETKSLPINASPTETTTNTTEEYSFRSAVNLHNSIVEAPVKTNPSEPPVQVGATTAGNGNGGGVDKSVIGLVVAGMVVIVAGITIKKNWSSIKKRFSSNTNSRTPNERNGTNANATAPEEVPLQDKDKSPV